MTIDIQKEALSWEGFGAASRELATVVAEDHFCPDLILSIARGGMFVAGALGYALSVKNIHLINVEFYTGVDQRLAMPVVLPPVPDLVDLATAKVLVADDVADTGATLDLVMNFCRPKVAEARSVVLYEKPRSLIKCDYVWKRTDDWIAFPWSAEAPVAGGSISDGGV